MFINNHTTNLTKRRTKCIKSPVNSHMRAYYAIGFLLIFCHSFCVFFSTLELRNMWWNTYRPSYIYITERAFRTWLIPDSHGCHCTCKSMLDNIFFCMNNFHLACPLQENSSLPYREIGYTYRTFAFHSYPVFELNLLILTCTCLYAFINIFLFELFLYVVILY